MKKTLKITLYSIIAIVVILLTAIPVYISYWRSSSTINTFHTFKESSDISFTDIKWENGLIGEEEIERIAFLVPVKIKGLNGNLFMQFDSGTQTTLLYGKTLNQLLEPNSEVEIFFDSDSLRYLKDPILSIAKNQFHTAKLRIASTLGDTEIDTIQILIGSIGFDAFVDRTIILDFKNDQLAITETDAKELSYKLDFMKDASVDKFPLLLPAKIGNNNTKLFFDTGASMFSLITSNKRLQNIDNNDADSLCCINNWGRQIPVYRKVLDTPLQIGEISYENQDIYGCEVLDMVDYLPSWFLYGMTGNRLFHDKIVVIDTENNLVGIEG